MYFKGEVKQGQIEIDFLTVQFSHQFLGFFAKFYVSNLLIRNLF